MNVLDMKTIQWNTEYDFEIRKAHLVVLMIDKYTYYFRHAQACERMGRGSGNTPFWSPASIVECPDCPQLDDLHDEVNYWADWLEEYCHPGYTGIAGGNEWERATWHLDINQKALNKHYPLV